MHYCIEGLCCQPGPDIDDLIYGDIVTVPSERFFIL